MADFEKLEWTLAEAFNNDFNNYARLKEPRDVSRENKAFAFPGPYSRNIAGTNIDQKMKRGFMRSIIMDKDISEKFKVTSPGNLRLNFQFNPEYIERNVRQSPGAVNPLLQNPANLTQAVPGTAEFSFTMMFNREAEVAQRRRDLILGTQRIQGSADRIEANLAANIIDDINTSDITNALKDPGKVGVMHDLSIFDSIIGQGITEELVNVISAYTQQQTVAITNEADEDDEITVFDKTKFEESVTKNFGNSAFLNPMPVRIVFSDLFMVEGLVVGSAVAFQKFSQDMIPTICQINCTVYALYVGFAKRKAFLTDNLTSWAVQTANAVKETQAATAQATKQLQQSIHKLNVGINAVAPGNALTVPATNSIGMKVFQATNTGVYLENASIYYAGNGSTAANRFVTLPQWFNAFAASNNSLGIMKNTAGSYVGNTVLSSFGKTALPITLYVTTTDASFNTVSSSLTSSIIDTNTSQNKSAVITGGGTWTKITDKEMGFLAETTVNGVKFYVFKNTFNLDPVDITSVKQTINHTSRCKLILNITFQKTLSDGSTAKHEINQDLYYNGTDPFFYDVVSGVNNNFDLVKKYVFNLKKPTGKELK